MLRNERLWISVGLILTLLSIFCSAAFLKYSFTIIWLIVIGLMLLFLYLAGWGITGAYQPFPFLINEQNRMSTSKMQMSLWTILILSSYLVAVFANIRSGFSIDTALGISIPEELWVALGISTVALVGSPLINSTKKKKDPNKKVFLKTLDGTLKDECAGKEAAADLKQIMECHTEGQLIRNKDPQEASLYEIISGEEIGNYKIVDLARIQVLFFTLIMVVTYGAAIGNMFSEASKVLNTVPISAFPELGTSGNTLLALSTAGYLFGKAVNQTPEEKPG